MILIPIKKRNSIIIFILLIFIIISSKTFASNKNFQDKNFLSNRLKFYEKILITKTNIKEWIKDLNNDLFYLEQKIIINKDYLKLINKFPSKKNIKSFDINQDLKKYKNKINEYHESIDALKYLYKLLSLEENFNIYLVKHYINHEKSKDEEFIMVSFCSENFNYDKEVKGFRKNLIKAFYFLEPKFYLSHENLLNYSKRLGLSESKLQEIACKELNEKKYKSI